MDDAPTLILAAACYEDKSGSKPNHVDDVVGSSIVNDALDCASYGAVEVCVVHFKLSAENERFLVVITLIVLVRYLRELGVQFGPVLQVMI